MNDMQHGEHCLVFLNSLLQLQGIETREATLKDAHGSILLWNGEVFDGLDVSLNSNDGIELLHRLSLCADDDSIAIAMSSIRGPWAFVYYNALDSSVWFGRDFMGRKSLLLQVPQDGNSLLMTSVGPQDRHMGEFIEIPPGIYRMKLSDDTFLLQGISDVLKCRIPWADAEIDILAAYERSQNIPLNDTLDFIADESASEALVQQLLSLLHGAVTRRCSTSVHNPQFDPESNSRFMVLFSGGVDSTLLAAILHQVLPDEESIELCSICFAQGSSPDRLGALDAYKELKSLYPERKWKFIAVDSTYDELKETKDHLMELLYPSDTVMDFNIGGALWLASRGHGKLIDCQNLDPDANEISIVNESYKSEARVVFLGHGADELFAGYARHRTRFRNGGWEGLASELQLDVKRLWQRNFGRDDRVVSDHGKEGRVPFVDERILEFALNTHLGYLANLDLPIGEGDKIILRQCLRSLGLPRTSERHKRALQFGSRLAKAANAACFGSNTAANKQHGGKVKLSSIKQ
jgi:asparagine synthetase B (glutamine-hydrolysing)